MLSIGNQLTPEQRLSKAVVAIMGEPKYTALAGVLMIGDKSIRDDVPTACTNGRDEMYGRDFTDKLTDAELRFVILHENYHKLYRHLTTWRHLYDENPQLANMACDYVINLKIRDDNTDGFATVPDGALIDDRYAGMDTAQVYKLLRDDPEHQPKPQDGNPKKRLFRLQSDSAIINRMGFNNGGVEEAVARLKQNKGYLIST